MPHAITFVHSPSVEFGQNYGVRLAPLWAFTLAAYVPPSFEARVIDCTVQDPQQLEHADVFAFSGINQDLEAILRVRALLRQRYPHALFILGGPITWSFAQEQRLELLHDFDYLFVLDGEQTLPLFLRAFERGTLSELPRIIQAERFELAQARLPDFELQRRSAPDSAYQGAAIEVSRGCPFLCEFCDIRTLPGNNRANNKAIDVIIAELEHYRTLGESQVLFVCDNFIGDPRWARECADAIVTWREKTGSALSIFTWVTLNLATQPELMKQLRRAGFSVLYIGVESINDNALLETAKLQNRGDMRAALTRIHAHGFVIAPGLIFGFDSDSERVFDATLAFIRETGLIGGDPSFLSALPGTPLFERARRTARLVERANQATERRKIATNLRYLQDSGSLAHGFMHFIAELGSPAFQLARFERHLELMLTSREFVATGGTRSPGVLRYLRLQLSHPESRRMLAARLWFLAQPINAWTVLKGFLLWRRAERQRPGLGLHFHFWVYFWTNLTLKYRNLKAEDFDLHSAGPATSFDVIARDAAAALITSERLTNPRSKAARVARSTSAALERLAASQARPASAGDG